MNSDKLFAFLGSLLIYFLVILLIFIVFIYTPTSIPSQHFVAKNEKAIEVSLGSPVKKRVHRVKPKTKLKKHVKKKKKKIPKKVRNIKSRKKSKIVKKVKAKKKIEKRKKISSKKLFDSIQTPVEKEAKDSKMESEKSSGSHGDSLKKGQKHDRGIEKKYFANVENLLRGWPAQSNFAGEKIDVQLKIYSSGLFDYKILQKSKNPEFNEALENYLKQLQRNGFGPHNNDKPYLIEVEFVAKE